jgi:hypothetical protein
MKFTANADIPEAEDAIPPEDIVEAVPETIIETAVEETEINDISEEVETNIEEEVPTEENTLEKVEEEITSEEVEEKDVGQFRDQQEEVRMVIHFEVGVLVEAVFIVHHSYHKSHDAKDKEHDVGYRDVHYVDTLKANNIRIDHMSQIS